jgi:flagellar basal-body rod protein FlgB
MSGLVTNMFQNSTIPVLEQVVNYTQVRHNVLAGNIANLDTPGYKTQDISPQQFQAKLSEAIQARGEQPWTGAVEGEAMQARARRRADPMAEVRASLDGMLRHDEGNVGLEQQMTELTKNQMQHNLAVTIMTSQFRLLQAAISEKV